jgi:glutamate synthase domain-containing protein 3
VDQPTHEDLEALRDRIEQHAQLTFSRKAEALLDQWVWASMRFLKIGPQGQPGAAASIAVSLPAAAISLPATFLPNLPSN